MFVKSEKNENKFEIIHAKLPRSYDDILNLAFDNLRKIDDAYMTNLDRWKGFKFWETKILTLLKNSKTLN